jgi:hypothetical protein
LPYHEKRKSARKRVIRSAKLILDDGEVIDNCIVFNQSDDGALIELSEVVPVPPEVIIQFGTGTAVRAQRRWQVGKRVGLQFLERQVVKNDTTESLHVHESAPNSYGLPVAARHADTAARPRRPKSLKHD